MEQSNPVDTVNKLIKALNHGDLDTALNFYEPEAIVIAQPGNVARGRDEIRKALQGFVSLKPSIKTQAYEVVEAGNTALYCSRWTLAGTSEGKRVEMNGVSSDVLRRQADGRWLVAVDNPWGTSIVG